MESTQLKAQVIAVDRSHYTLQAEAGELRGQVSGLLHLEKKYPCVGDWVEVEVHQPDHAIIHRIESRATFLKRKTPGKKVDEQIIAANIDTALIVQSCHYDFNLRRLERYIVMVKESGIQPILILTKTDLVSKEELAALISKIKSAGVDIEIHPLSNMTEEGLAGLVNMMKPGNTYCLIGSSGVGKTTLLNHLTKNESHKTSEVSATGEGRHTTTRRQLICLENGVKIVDTPGIRELGVTSVGGVESGFSDVVQLVEKCKFSNCTHTNEPGCAIQEAINNGALDKKHFDSFMKLKRESEFYESSYAEKRQKDKSFGKMVKSVLKEKKRRR